MAPAKRNPPARSPARRHSHAASRNRAPASAPLAITPVAPAVSAHWGEPADTNASATDRRSANSKPSRSLTRVHQRAPMLRFTPRLDQAYELRSIPRTAQSAATSARPKLHGLAVIERSRREQPRADAAPRHRSAAPRTMAPMSEMVMATLRSSRTGRGPRRASAISTAPWLPASLDHVRINSICSGCGRGEAFDHADGDREEAEDRPR